MDRHEAQDLRRQIAALTQRVWRLEETMRAGSNPLDHAPSSAPEAIETPGRSQPAVLQEANPPIVAQAIASPADGPTFAAPERPRRRDQSLESRIGTHVFNRIGILAVLIAAAWFLKLAIDNHWIGPLGRIVIGLLSGIGLIVWSERFRRKNYPAFSYSLKALGSGVLYLSLWAAYDLYSLIPAGIAFLAMILVTAFNGYMAWAQDAELLALYAIVGGLGTPALVSTGQNHELTLFSYLLILDLAVLVLVTLKPWSRLLLAAFPGTLLYGLGWAAMYYRDASFALTSFFVGAFFLIFALAPLRLRSLRSGEPSATLGKRDQVVLTLLPLANAAAAFFCFYAMLTEPGRTWARPWMAVAFAAFYLILLRLPAPRAIESPTSLLSSLHVTFAVVFLTIAIPLEAKGRWITIGWLVEGAALVWMARRYRLLLLRILAAAGLMLGFVALLASNPYTPGPALLNARFATYAVGIAVFALSAWFAWQGHVKAEAAEAQAGLVAVDWKLFAAIAVLATNLLILIAVALEIHAYWWAVPQGSLQTLAERRMYAQFTYSAWFMLFGAALLAAGFLKSQAFLRWQALVLLAISIGKVFTVDLSSLSQGYRILSFLGLGVLLLAVSFVYQKDWLGLRSSRQAEGDPR